jgi:hypothetical protein
MSRPGTGRLTSVLATLVLFAFACHRDSPTSPGQADQTSVPVATTGCPAAGSAAADVPLLAEHYTYAYGYGCSEWYPSDPPSSETLLDIWTSGGDGSAPSADAIAAVEAIGGRVVHRFHVGKMRVIINPLLASSHSGRTTGTIGYSLETVVDRCNFDIDVIVRLEHGVQAADLARAQAIGATITYVYSIINGYAARIDDAAIPALRALPSVTSVEGCGFFCGY